MIALTQRSTGFVQMGNVSARTCTTFEKGTNPPVSKFTLDLDGGNKGLLVNSINFCSAAEHVNVQMDSQNGKTAKQNPVLETPCGKKQKRKIHMPPTVRRNRRGH